MSNGLDVALMNDPYAEWSPEAGDRHTDIAFSDPEWGSFFFDTLGVPEPTYIESEDYESRVAREVAAFSEALNVFPLLARVHHFYDDAHFAKDEIRPLREELQRAGELRMDDLARAFWKGMLEACDAAESANLGISLLSS